MNTQVLSPAGSMDNPDNHPIDHRRLLTARRSSLVQQAKGLEEQRRAILGEVGEIDRELGKIVTVNIGEADSIS